jgi:hypothetical protein
MMVSPCLTAVEAYDDRSGRGLRFRHASRFAQLAVRFLTLSAFTNPAGKQ